jgi:AraC-like DNA-binding protein
MNYQIELRSFFLLLATIQAVIFSVLLIVRHHSLSDKVLAAFLITLAATLGEHIAGWMGWYQGQALTFFPFGNNFLYPPLAYLYVRSITNTNYRLGGKDWLLFLPAAIYFTIHLSIWAMPVADKLSLLQELGNRSWPNFYFIEGTFDMLNLLVFTFLAIRHYRAYLLWLPSEFSNLQPVTLAWLRNFLVILFAVCFVELAFTLTSLFIDYWYDVHYWDYFIRAILLYYLSLAGFTYTQPKALAFDMGSGKPPVTLPQPIIISQTLEPLNQLIDYMQSAKPYLDAELSLKQLAEQLNLPASSVSQTINTCLGKNFNDFINEYRVLEICTRFKAGEHLTKTLLGVGLDSGFNSKATFNRSFKKITGLTPKEWVEQKLDSI